MADKNPILLRIYPHPPVAYGRLNVHIINNGDSDLPIRLCHFRGISASIYTLDYYDLGTISPGQHIVFPIDPSKIEPYKFHLFYVQEKTASGTYEYVSNLVRVVVASSPKITVKAKDILTGKDIPLEGAYVNLYLLPWELPATYIADANGEVTLPVKRDKETFILTVYKKTPLGTYYYVENWDGKSKTIVPEFATTFFVDVEYKIDDWGKLIDRICAGQTGTAQILKNYFKTLNPNKEADRYRAEQTILSLLYYFMPQELKAKWNNYIVNIKVDFANKKIYVTFRVGQDPVSLAIALGLVILGAVIGYIAGRSAGDAEKAKAVADIWKDADKIIQLINDLEKQGLLTPEEAKTYINKILELLGESQKNVQPDGTTNLVNTVVAILPLIIIIMLVKSLMGVVKR